MHAITTHRTGRLLLAAAAIAVPAALPSGAAAHHQCNESRTLVTVDPSSAARPVDVDNRLPLFYTCGPHRTAVIYLEPDGSRDELSLQSGDLALTRTGEDGEATRDRSTTPAEDARPAQDARPARRARRSCKRARKAKSHARSRARRRACRRRR